MKRSLKVLKGQFNVDNHLYRNFHFGKGIYLLKYLLTLVCSFQVVKFVPFSHKTIHGIALKRLKLQKSKNWV